MAKLQLRPLSVGETLDATFSIYKDRFKTMVTIVAVVLVPIGILSAIINASLVSDVESNLETGLLDFGGSIAAASIVSVLAWIAQMLATAGVVKAVAGEYLGGSVTWQAALDAARQRLGALLLGSFLIALGVGIGFIFFIIPGLILLVSWALAIPAMVIEGVSATDGIKRSWSLVSGRRWPILGVFVVLYIVILIFSLILTGILTGVTFLAGTLASGLVGIIPQLLVAPLLSIAITVVYFDQRVRKEGFDLELLAGQIGSSIVHPPADPGIQTGFDTPAPESDSNPPPEAGDAWPPANE